MRIPQSGRETVQNNTSVDALAASDPSLEQLNRSQVSADLLQLRQSDSRAGSLPLPKLHNSTTIQMSHKRQG